MSKGARWFIFTAGVAALLASGSYLLFSKYRISLKIESRVDEEAAPEREAVPVTAISLGRKEFVDRGEYRAKLSAANSVMVTAEIAGTVVEDMVSEGSRVREKQPLYRLQDDAYRFAMDQASAARDLAQENFRKIQNISRPEDIARLEALLDEAGTSLEKAKSDAARFEELYREGAVPLNRKESADLVLSSARARAEVARENLEEARSGARSEDRAAAEAAVRQAEAAYQLARNTWEKAVIRSPIPGIVASKKAFTGDTLQPGMPVAEVVDLSFFKINLGVSGDDVGYFSAGDAVTVDTVPQGPSFTATVEDVGVKADEKTGSFPVIITMKTFHKGDPEIPLRAGLDVKVAFIKQKVSDALVVPVSALLQELGREAVFVVEGETAVRREISVGPSAEGVTVVTGGLEAGELLVVVGQQRLQDGDRVELSIEE